MLVAVVIFDRVSLAKEQFFYLVPRNLCKQVSRGSIVVVPFGRQQKRGLVAALLADTEERAVLKPEVGQRLIKLREIVAVADTAGLIPNRLIKLAFWLADYYHCSLFKALRLVLPGEVMINKTYKPQQQRYLSCRLTPADQQRALSTLKRSPAQQRLLTWAQNNLREVKKETLVLQQAKVTKSAAAALIAKGWFKLETREVSRQSWLTKAIMPQANIALNREQEKAYRAIVAGHKRVSLLFGVTSSGKTEVYLAAANALTKAGGQVLLLVPEIALTAQLVQRCSRTLGGNIAVWHSRLGVSERLEIWRRARTGEVKAVIGSRSAVFLPLPDLRAIFVDEEHDWSYKQDQSPRYHTRAVAEKISELTGCKLVLGSATPALETFYRAQQGEFELLTLLDRAKAASLPTVEIVDLKTAERAQNSFYLSQRLVTAIAERLVKKEQTILFLNRRGAATALICRDCGERAQCPQCDVTLTLHYDRPPLLLCHYCGRRASVPAACPRCQGKSLLNIGFGTQKVVADLQAFFPQARIVRIDRDSLDNKQQPQRLLAQLQRPDTDIIVGTQMIAKGWDLPRVSLIGVALADFGLHLPDFRANERVFQLLTQVAGRAGRADIPGEVIIQTLSMENETLRQAARQDFMLFYQREIAIRQRYGYPPFGRLVKLTYVAPTFEEAWQQVKIITTRLREHVPAGECEVLGPILLGRLAGKYHYQILLKGKKFDRALKLVDRDWRVDIDPV